MNDQQQQFMNAYNDVVSTWPIEYKEVDVSTRFGSTHVIISGKEDAKPLILLHGAMFSSTMWQPNVKQLSEKYKVYCVDIVDDLNKSQLTTPLVDRNDFANWLVEVLDQLEIDKCYMAGLSYGAAVTINFSLFHPERVEKIVAMSPADSLVPLNREFYSRVFSMMQPNGVKEFMEWVFEDRYTVSESFMNQIESAVKAIDWTKPRTQKMFPVTYTDSELQSMTVPTLLLLGENEVMFSSVEASNRAEHLMPSVKIEMLPKSGHVLSMEKPELVNVLMIEFLEE